MSEAPKRRERSRAEWMTFALASALLAVLAGLIVAELPRGDRPPAPAARVVEVTPRAGRFVVRVEVENLGEQTAENVQVVGTLEVEGTEVEGDQTIDFLSGGETVELELVFEDDPADGELDVRVSGYLLP